MNRINTKLFCMREGRQRNEIQWSEQHSTRKKDPLRHKMHLDEEKKREQARIVTRPARRQENKMTYIKTIFMTYWMLAMRGDLERKLSIPLLHLNGKGS